MYVTSICGLTSGNHLRKHFLSALQFTGLDKGVFFPRDCAYHHNLGGAVWMSLAPLLESNFLEHTFQTDMLLWCDMRLMWNHAWCLLSPTEKLHSYVHKNVSFYRTYLSLCGILWESVHLVHSCLHGLVCYVLYNLEVATCPLYCVLHLYFDEHNETIHLLRDI